MLVMISGVGQKIVSMLVGFVARQVFIYFLGQEFAGINGLFSKVLSFLSLADAQLGQGQKAQHLAEQAVDAGKLLPQEVDEHLTGHKAHQHGNDLLAHAGDHHQHGIFSA